MRVLLGIWRITLITRGVWNIHRIYHKLLPYCTIPRYCCVIQYVLSAWSCLTGLCCPCISVASGSFNYMTCNNTSTATGGGQGVEMPQTHCCSGQWNHWLTVPIIADDYSNVLPNTNEYHPVPNTDIIRTLTDCDTQLWRQDHHMLIRFDNTGMWWMDEQKWYR